MRTEPRCIPCVLYDVYNTSKLVTEDVTTQLAILRGAARVIAERLDPKLTPAQLSTHAYRVVKRLTGVEEPYKELKRLSNLAAERVCRRVERKLGALGDAEARFRLCVLYSVAGNVIDYSVLGYGLTPSHDLERRLNEVVGRGLSVDDASRIWERVRRSGRVLYVLDNSGEAVFDRLLIKEIKEYGPEVTAVVKGYPVSNDLTLSDALQIGLDRVADRVITTGSDAYGIGLPISGELATAIDECDIVISKGQANYEDLSEIERGIRGSMAYLLCAKCEPVARDFGVTVGQNVAKCVR